MREGVRRQMPFFLLLLPLSFAAQSLSEQFGRASVSDALFVAAVAAGGIIAASLVLRIFFPPKAAALSAAVAGILFLYWSYPYLRLKSWGGAGIGLKAVLIGAVVLWALVSWAIGRASGESQRKTVRFFNLLFGVLLFVHAGFYMARKAGSTSLVEGKTATSKSTLKPAVFILLFDEAGSTASLRRQGISDFGLDSFLKEQGFFQAAQSRSNYSITHFSMASVLNERYLSLPAAHRVTLHDYNAALCCIRRSSLVRSFEESGYQVCNRSVFELGNHRPFRNETPLIEGPEVLTAGTLWARVLRPVWTHRKGEDSLNWFRGLARNEDLLKAVSADAKVQKPLFSYAHFFLPHSPFYYAAGGGLRSFRESLQASAENHVAGYAANWQGAVQYIKTAVQSIQQQNPAALILLIGDHGYRNEKLPGNDSAQFQNLCAVYYPDGNYAGWTNHTTLVNAMRLLHNKALGTALPLLPEKTIPLHDATQLDW